MKKLLALVFLAVGLSSAQQPFERALIQANQLRVMDYGLFKYDTDTTAPPAGYIKLVAVDGSTFYLVTPAGTRVDLTEAGTGGGGGGSGTVTSVSSANADISVATGTTTPVLTLNSGTSANQVLKLDASALIPVASIPGNSITSARIVDATITAGDIATGQVVKSINGLKDVVYVAGIGGAGVSVSNDTLYINAGSGGGGGSITTIQNTNNTLDILDPNGATTTINVKSGGITATELATGAVTSTDILDGTVALADMASNSVDASKIVDASVTGSDIASGTVTSGNILDGTIATGDISTGGVATGNILDGTVSGTDIAAGTVTSSNILDATIANADLAASSVSSSNITDGTIAAADLATTGVTAATYGSATTSAQVTVNTKGQVTNAASVTISGTVPGGSAGGSLAGTYPNPTLNPTGVNAGTYGSGTNIPVMTVTAEGRVSVASSTPIDTSAGGLATAWDVLSIMNDATFPANDTITVTNAAITSSWSGFAGFKGDPPFLSSFGVSCFSGYCYIYSITKPMSGRQVSYFLKPKN